MGKITHKTIWTMESWVSKIRSWHWAAFLGLTYVNPHSCENTCVNLPGNDVNVLLKLREVMFAYMWGIWRSLEGDSSLLELCAAHVSLLFWESVSHTVPALGHSQEFRHPNMCFEKSHKPNCLLLTHVTLHKKGSQGKVKELKGKLCPGSALEALDSFLLLYQRVIINFLLRDRSSCKIVLFSPTLPFFLRVSLKFVFLVCTQLLHCVTWWRDSFLK